MYRKSKHAAAHTDEYLFHQLIPYIGSKRRLLGLLRDVLRAAGLRGGETFLDLFAGSGVVSRLAKERGLRVVANDWEPYAEALNGCYVACDGPPEVAGRPYADAIAELNALPPHKGWVTRHLCPDDDDAVDPARDRQFFQRKNGARIDAIRGRIAEWDDAGELTDAAKNCLLAPLLYETCYRSNTSGVFKGFHNGWGGATGTALYRIAGDLRLRPAVFCDNGTRCEVRRQDAAELAAELAAGPPVDFAYLDPPYNQHPYGSNYHVLNTVTLDDRPPLAPKISGRDKAAIRTDWRTARRSPFNARADAVAAYASLLDALHARFIATSYSTDGFVPVERMVAQNVERGAVRVFLKPYKRYRVSSQRFSAKPLERRVRAADGYDTPAGPRGRGDYGRNSRP